MGKISEFANKAWRAVDFSNDIRAEKLIKEKQEFEREKREVEDLSRDMDEIGGLIGGFGKMSLTVVKQIAKIRSWLLHILDVLDEKIKEKSNEQKD